MQITRNSIDTQKGPADWFTGDVYIDAVAAPAGTSTFAAAAVHFALTGRFGPFARAKLALLGSLPAVLRKRAAVQRTRRVGPGAIWPLLERRWLSTKMSEKRFDVGLAGDNR